MKFHLVADAYLIADDIEDALAQLARHFTSLAMDQDGDSHSVFCAGSLELKKVEERA